MAKVINLGHTDTPISGVTVLNFARGLLNYNKDWRVKSNINGKEIVLTNITSPIDRPEQIRIAYSEIANIYSGTGIEPSLALPTKRGFSILVQLTTNTLVTDTTDPDFNIVIPGSTHLVLKFPASEYVTSDLVLGQVGRLLSGLFDTGSLTNARLDAIMRGSLVPTDV